MSLRTLLVIPAYRESARLPRYLGHLLPALEASEFAVDVLVVDDGSGHYESEALVKSINTLRPSYPFLQPPLLLPENQGKGAAVRAGWSQSENHELLAFVDADGSIPAGEILRLLPLTWEEPGNNTALFASRIKMMGRTIQRHFHRHLMGRLYATLIGLLLDVPVYDSQCGLKIIHADSWQKIRPRLSENGFAFDVDLLLALLEKGVRIREVPIDWSDVEGSKVRLFSDSLRMFRAVLRLQAVYRSPA